MNIKTILPHCDDDDLAGIGFISFAATGKIEMFKAAAANGIAITRNIYNACIIAAAETGATKTVKYLVENVRCFCYDFTENLSGEFKKICSNAKTVVACLRCGIHIDLLAFAGDDYPQCTSAIKNFYHKKLMRIAEQLEHDNHDLLRQIDNISI